MVLDFETLPSEAKEHFKGGEGTLGMQAHADALNRIMRVTLPAGASIGMHTHDTSSEIVYVLAGEGVVRENGGETPLRAGLCTYCPKGSAHSIANTGRADLVLFAVVPNQ